MIRLMIRFSYILLVILFYSLGLKRARGERIRKGLEALGPVFIKFGQLLSTRSDLIPSDIQLHLSKLQDKVPVSSGNNAIKVIEKAFKQPIHQIFKTFTVKPLTSASVAEIHEATLPGGESVVVKMIRPNTHIIIQQDLKLLSLLLKSFDYILKNTAQFKLQDLIQELKPSLLNELDCLREAANAAQLKKNLEQNEDDSNHSTQNLKIYIPKIYWDYTKRHILVMEKIQGIPIYDTETLKAQGIDLKALSEKIIHTFLTQALKHRFFHADMHPGNLLVCTEQQAVWLTLIDFGIVGHLTLKDQYYLSQNLKALLNKNYRRIAELHVESGWVPKTISVSEFESQICAVLEPVFERPLKEISVARTLLLLLQTAKKFEVHVQPQLWHLQKTLLQIESLTRMLNPDLDFFDTIQTQYHTWIQKEVKMKDYLNKWQEALPQWLQKLPELPEKIHEVWTSTQHQQAALMEVLKKNNSKISKKDFIYGMLMGMMGILMLGLLWYQGYLHD